MTNPYSLLKIPSDATTEEIEAAYERLFDRYESRALAGDADAVASLQQLNDAYDTLNDSQRRAAIDKGLSGGRGREQAAVARSGSKAHGKSSQALAPGRPRPASQTLRMASRTRNLPRNVQSDRSLPIVPIFLLGLLAFALAAAVTYMLVSRQDGVGQQSENRGNVVATVNGQPIYEQDYLERSEMDRKGALEDPMFGIYFQTLTPFSQTQALETLKSDSLDRLINFEVLMQQAQKEGLYPGPDQQRTLIEEAKGREVKGQNFAEFLKERNITEGQYNRRIIRNVVYTVVAEAHITKTGSAEAHRSAFFQWVCETRKGYNVKINITFPVANPPCTSDLPPELPLPGIDTTVPEPEGTVGVPATQGPQGPPAPP